MPLKNSPFGNLTLQMQPYIKCMQSVSQSLKYQTVQNCQHLTSVRGSQIFVLTSGLLISIRSRDNKQQLSHRLDEHRHILSLSEIIICSF